MLKLFSLLCIATLLVSAYAGIIPAGGDYAPTIEVVHNRPSAISHQSFTRILNKPQLDVAITPTVQSYEIAAAQSLATHAIPPTPAHEYDFAASFGAPSSHGRHTSVVNTLSHTPAHLTYAASPVVYKTLPLAKPVHSISYDEVQPYFRTNSHYE